MTSIDDPKPNPHASAEEVEAALKDTKLAQVLYHDWEAETYDEKWSISFDERCIDYAKGRFDRIVPDAELPYGRAMVRQSVHAGRERYWPDGELA